MGTWITMSPVLVVFEFEQKNVGTPPDLGSQRRGETGEFSYLNIMRPTLSCNMMLDEIF